MKVKKSLYITLAALAVLPIIVIVAALFQMPYEVPMHYGADMIVDRFGSKYETLLFPVITVISGLIVLLFAHIAGKSEKNGVNNKRITLIFGNCLLAVQNILLYYITYMQLNNVVYIPDVPINLIQVIFLLIGVLFIIMGNLMPKLRMNSLVGLRTRWSMKNETAWKKSQLYSGICLIITGFVMIILAIINANVFLYIATLALAIIISTILSYAASK